MVLKQRTCKNEGVLQTNIFPQQLHNTLENNARLTEDIIPGFQFTGIVPLNTNVVLDEEIAKRLLTFMIAVL